MCILIFDHCFPAVFYGSVCPGPSRRMLTLWQGSDLQLPPMAPRGTCGWGCGECVGVHAGELDAACRTGACRAGRAVATGG